MKKPDGLVCSECVMSSDEPFHKMKNQNRCFLVSGFCLDFFVPCQFRWAIYLLLVLIGIVEEKSWNKKLNVSLNFKIGSLRFGVRAVYASAIYK